MGSPPPPPPLGGCAPRPLRGGAASPNSSCCCFLAAFAIGGGLPNARIPGSEIVTAPPDARHFPPAALEAGYRRKHTMAGLRVPGFRLGIYVFKDVEVVDFAAPHGVFSVARRFDAGLDAFLIADAMRRVRRRPGSPCYRTTASRIARRWTPS